MFRITSTELASPEEDVNKIQRKSKLTLNIRKSAQEFLELIMSKDCLGNLTHVGYSEDKRAAEISE